MMVKYLVAMLCCISITASAKGKEQPGKYGYINPTGKVVIPCQWDDATTFRNKRASVKLDGKWAVIDNTGKPLTGFNLDIPVHFINKQVAVVEIAGKMGVINRQGKFILAPKWEKVELEEYYQWIKAKSRAQTVYFDFQGQKLIESPNNNDLYRYNKLFLDSTGKKNDLYSAGGKLLYKQLDKVEVTPLGIAFTKQGLSGYVSKNLVVDIPPIHQRFTAFKNGYCAIHTDKLDTLITPRGEGIPFVKYSITEEPDGFSGERGFGGSFIMVQNRTSGMYGFAKASGEIAHPCVWDSISPYEQGLAIVFSKGKYGAIDLTGKLVIPTVWEGVRIDKYNMIEVRRNNLSGSVNRKGEVIIKPSWNLLDRGPFENTWQCDSKDGSGIISLDGKLITPAIWDEFDDDNDLASVVVKRELEGLISNKGEVISKPIWSDVDIENFSQIVVVTEPNSKKLGALDRNGEVLLQPEWDWLSPSRCGGFILAGKEKVETNTFQIFDVNGKLLIEDSWLNIEDLADGPYLNAQIGYSYYHGYLVEKFDKEHVLQGYIDKHGKFTIPCIYLDVDLFSDNGIFAVEDQSGLYGFRDTTGKWITPLKWQDAKSFSEGLAPVQRRALTCE